MSQRLGRQPPLVVSAPTTTTGRRARPARTPSRRSSPREAAQGHRSGPTRTLSAIDGLSAGEGPPNSGNAWSRGWICVEWQRGEVDAQQRSRRLGKAGDVAAFRREQLPAPGALGGRCSGKPAVPAAAAPAAPFTRKRRRPARSGRGQSASGPRAVPCPKRRRAGADRCTRIWANVSARPGWRRGGRHRRSERPHGGYLGRMRASRNPRKAGAHPAAVGCPRRGERGLGADWTDVRRTRAFVAVSPGTNRQCNEATTAGSVFGSYRRDRASCLHGRWRNRAEALRGSVTSSVESDLCACCRWNRLWRA